MTTDVLMPLQVGRWTSHSFVCSAFRLFLRIFINGSCSKVMVSAVRVVIVPVVSEWQAG